MVTATPGQKPAAAYTTGLLSPQPTAVQAPWLDDTAVAYTQGTIIPENTVQAHITTSPMRSVSSESIIFRINGKQVTGVYMDQGYNNLVLRVGEITLTSGGSPALLEEKSFKWMREAFLPADGSAIQIVSGTPWMAQATPCSTICGTQKRFESEDAASYLDTPSSFSKNKESSQSKSLSKEINPLPKRLMPMIQ